MSRCGLLPRLPDLAGSAFVLASLASAWVAGCSQPPSDTAAAPDASASGRTEKPAFAASDSCGECHPHETSAWTGSDHDLAMQEAGPETVLGDFGDVTFAEQGLAARFFRRADEYWVHTEGPDGGFSDFRITYTFGFDPLQQYLVEFPGGRMQALTVAWDTQAGRWFSLYPGERFAPDDPLHWTGIYQNWNAMCADCHSTGLVKGYDAERDVYRTTWHDLDVGCQACHGPGAAHVSWARAAAAGSAAPAPEPAHGFPAVLQRGRPAAQIDACAPCHSRRHALVAEAGAGSLFTESYEPRRLEAGLYHADGQIEGEVYVWGSFVQSKMHARGVACSDCHDPHGLDLWLPGDAVCTQCHTPQAPLERFPTLKAVRYDSREHHHHPEQSDGARCVSCHMPARTYMQVDPRRDHSLRIPRPDLAAELGTPDACSTCHPEGPAWAAARVEEWYGVRERPRHFAAAFARARQGARSAGPGLEAVARDSDLPALVRATALELLGSLGTGLATLEAALADPASLVRTSAARALESLPLESLAPLLAPLAHDASRPVRVEVGRQLGPAVRQLPARDRAAVEKAHAEFLDAQEVALDMPGAHLNLAVDAERSGDFERAVAAYETALRLDPFFLPARFNLAQLFDQIGRPAEAERVLRAGRERFPEDGELAYSHGLVLGELEQWEAARDALALAAERLPDRARVHYNSALVLRQLGRETEMEMALLTAAGLDPDDLDVAMALLDLYARRKAWDLARPWALRVKAAGRRLDPELLEHVETGH